MGPSEAEKDLTEALMRGVDRGLWNIGRSPTRTAFRVRRYVKKGMPRMNTATVTDEKTETPPSTKNLSGSKSSLEKAIAALKKISELQNNNKLRSWRGSEAVRIATEALKEIG